MIAVHTWKNGNTVDNAPKSDKGNLSLKLLKSFFGNCVFASGKVDPLYALAQCTLGRVKFRQNTDHHP